MFENERQFEELIHKLDIDTTVNELHKAKLRAKMVSMAKAGTGGRRFPRIVLSIAAGLLVIAVVGKVVFFSPKSGIEPRKTVAIRNGVLVSDDYGTKEPPQSEGPVAVNDRPMVARLNSPAVSGLSSDADSIVSVRLEKIKTLARAKDVDGLAKLLDSSDSTEKLLAAKYLADFLGADAVEILKVHSAGNFDVSGFIATGQAKSAEPVEVAAVMSEIVNDGALIILAVDKTTKQRLAGVALEIRKGRKFVQGVTDSAGEYRWEKPEKIPDYFNIEVSKKTYCPMQMHWNKADAGEENFPGIIEFEMSPAITVGGVVTDAQDVPIENAVVRIYAGSSQQNQPNFDINAEEIKTDSQGQWVCETFPEDAYNASIGAKHPEYINENRSYSADIGQLKEFTHKTILKKGVAITGRVLDRHGNPLAGASILQGGEKYSRENKVKADEQGNFTFLSVPPGALMLTAQHKAASPAMIEIEADANTGPVIFNLAAPCEISGRVVDINGLPIKGVYFDPVLWNGCNTLSARIASNKDGYFKWKNAPAGEVLFRIGKQGFATIDKFAMSSENDYVITMAEPLKVAGRVFDEDTNEPVNSFEIVKGFWYEHSSRVSWERHRPAAKFTSGSYELTSSEPYDLQLRVEAEGYLPAVSPVFSPGEGSVIYDFYLEPTENIRGKVLLSTGQPGRGVKVVMATPSNYTYLQNSRLTDRDRSLYTETDANGIFSFTPTGENYLLVAIGDAGYAEVMKADFEKLPVLNLQQWGQVEGQLIIDGNPAANENLILQHRIGYSYEPNRPQFGSSYQTVTDANGFFRFERVSPGDATLYRILQVSNYQSKTTHQTVAEVLPGETTAVTLGGTGVKVVGKLDIPASLVGKVKFENASGYLNADFRSMFILPDGFENMNWQEKYDWFMDFSKSERAKELQKNFKHYNAIIDSNGTFTIDDVVPGGYKFGVSVQDRNFHDPYQRASGRPERIAKLAADCEIPESALAGGGAYDIGSFTLEPVKTLDVGTEFPDFEIKTFDNQIFSTASQKGKYLIIHLGYIYPPGQRGAPANTYQRVKQIHDEFSGMKDLQILSLTYLVDPKVIKEFVGENQVTWPIGIIEQFSGDVTPFETLQNLGLNGNGIVLLGPDGKIAARETDAEKFYETVKAILTRN